MRKAILVISLCIIAYLGAGAQNVEPKCRNWIIPKYLNIQYSGGVGNYVIGAGYILNKSQSLRLIIQYGLTPKYVAKYRLHTSSLKFTYNPVRIKIYNELSIAPTVSLGMSRVFADGPGTFTRLPSYYPDGYYAPNAFRAHFSLGGVLRYDLKQKYFVQAVELYLETTTNDLYVHYYVNYDPIKLTDIFSMAIGINILMGRW